MKKRFYTAIISSGIAGIIILAVIGLMGLVQEPEYFHPYFHFVEGEATCVVGGEVVDDAKVCTQALNNSVRLGMDFIFRNCSIDVGKLSSDTGTSSYMIIPNKD